MRKKNVPGVEYAPTTGVRTDLKRFMNQFLAKNTVRFEHFSEVWREKNMSYLCAGRCTDREAREFVERVMLIAQEYFLPPYQFQVRVGGLYLLYSIYQIQPLLPKVKIRMTPTYWQDTVFFQQQAAQQNHLDVVYVFQRLLHEQAFLFCYTPSEMSIHSSMKDVEEREDNLADNLKEEKSTIGRLFNYESLEKLSYLQDQYQQMKISLAGQNATKPDKSLDVVQGELVEDIVVLLQSFKEKVTSVSTNRQRAESTSQEKEHVPETTGERRQMLKTQAFNQTKTQPNKRNLVVASKLSSSPAQCTTSDVESTPEIMRGEVLPPVTKNTQKSLSKLPVVDIGDSSITSGSDEDYVPSKNLSTKKNITKKQARQEGKISPLKKGSAVKDLTEVMKPMTASSLNIKDTKSQDSMPVLDICDMPIESHIQSSYQISSERILAGNDDNVSGNRATETLVPVRKRGRPRTYSTSPAKTKIAEILVNPKHHLQESCKENPNQKSSMLPTKKKSDDTRSTNQNDDKDMSLTNKISFRWKRSEKNPVDQAASAVPSSKEGMNLEKFITETVAPARKRGRPKVYHDPAVEMIPTEVIVYPKAPSDSNKQVKTSAGKYEMVYFPAGMPQATDVLTTQNPVSHQESGNLSEAVKQMTKARQTKRKTEAEQATSAEETPAKQGRKRAYHEPIPETVTEIIVRKELGKPVVTESFTKSASSNKEGHMNETLGDAVSVKNLSYYSSSVNFLNASRIITVQNNLSGPAKVVKKKAAPNDAIRKLKERCKRKLAEEEEPIGQFIKRCNAMERKRSHAVTVLSSDEEKLASDCDNQKDGGKNSAVINSLTGVTQFVVHRGTKQSVIPAEVNKFIQEYEAHVEKQNPISTETKIIKTTSDSNLLPWTSICSNLYPGTPKAQRNSRPRGRPRKTEAEIQVKTKLDASSVQYRFL